MGADNLTYVVATGEDSQEVPVLESLNGKRIKELLADAFTFVRAVEINRAISAVTLEQLIGDQIKRNGETQASNAAQYNPYAYDPEKTQAASTETTEPANFLGGSDTGAPTKISRILAIKNEISSMVDALKEVDPLNIAGEGEYAGTDKGPSGQNAGAA